MDGVCFSVRCDSLTGCLLRGQPRWASRTPSIERSQFSPKTRSNSPTTNDEQSTNSPAPEPIGIDINHVNAHLATATNTEDDEISFPTQGNSNPSSPGNTNYRLESDAEIENRLALLSLNTYPNSMKCRKLTSVVI